MGKLRIKYDKYLKKYFGYDSLKVLQFKIIYYIIKKKKDICGILATGFGKSICYQLPLLITKKSVLVVENTINMRMRVKKGLQQMTKNCTQFSSGFSKSTPLPIYTTHPPQTRA